jgi:single-stranded DNA-binding protein
MKKAPHNSPEVRVLDEQLSFIEPPTFRATWPMRNGFAERALKKLLEGQALEHLGFLGRCSSWRQSAAVFQRHALGWPIDASETLALTEKHPGRTIALYKPLARHAMQAQATMAGAGRAMSIEALILGKLYQRAELRTSKTGRQFVTTKVRVATGEGDSLFVNVVAFGDAACAELLALNAGDSLVLAGTLKPGAWTDREGNARPSVDLVAAQVLTLYRLKKKRDASGQAAARPSAASHAPAAEELGNDDEWLTGGEA